MCIPEGDQSSDLLLIHHQLSCHIHPSLSSDMTGTWGYIVASRVPWIFLLCITTP